MEDSFAEIFSRHKDRRISEMRQRWRDSKLHYTRNYKYWILVLKWWGNIPEDYSKHLEKRIKEMRERMVKSKLDRAKKRKYRTWIVDLIG